MTLPTGYVLVCARQRKAGRLVVIKQGRAPRLIGVAHLASGFFSVAGELSTMHVFMAIRAQRPSFTKDDLPRGWPLPGVGQQLRFVTPQAGSRPVSTLQCETCCGMIERRDAAPRILRMALRAILRLAQLVRVLMAGVAIQTVEVEVRFL